jgi:peptidyl-prolyl cis-trans isomerase D
MLDDLKSQSRDKRKKITAWVLFSAIILVFILWGLSPRGRDGIMSAGGGAAQVNSKTISLRDLNDQVDRMRQNIATSPYAAFFEGEAGRQRLQQTALDQLVRSEVVAQACEENKLWSSDGSIAEIIRTAAPFNVDGQFRRELYMNYLENRRTTAGEFEESLRKMTVEQNAHRVFEDALKVTPQEVQKQMELKDLKANVDYLTIESEKIVTPEKVTETDIQNFIQQKDSAKKLKDYYATHSSEFNSDEQIHARHILVKFDNKNKDSEETAKKKASELLAQLKKGADFVKLANDNSDDPGSKAKGGDLGFFGRGKLVPEFEKVAFSLSPKALSDLVKTEYGYHIIQVLEKKPKETKSFEASQNMIARKLVAEKKSEDLVAQVKELLKKSDVAGLDQFASAHNLKWEATGNFGITENTIPKIGSNEDFAKKAFGLTAKAPLANELVRQGEKSYVLKYKAVSKEVAKAPKVNTKGKMAQTQANARADESEVAQKPEVLAQNLSAQRSQDAFGRWIDIATKNSNIEKSKSFSSSQNEAAPEF